MALEESPADEPENAAMALPVKLSAPDALFPISPPDWQESIITITLPGTWVSVL